MGGGKGSAAAGTSNGAIRPGDWVCMTCRAVCFAEEDSCYRCGERRPRPGAAGGRLEQDSRAEDRHASEDLRDKMLVEAEKRCWPKRLEAGDSGGRGYAPY